MSLSGGLLVGPGTALSATRLKFVQVTQSRGLYLAPDAARDTVDKTAALPTMRHDYN
jgi:hypothetical protein